MMRSEEQRHYRSSFTEEEAEEPRTEERGNACKEETHHGDGFQEGKTTFLQPENCWLLPGEREEVHGLKVDSTADEECESVEEEEERKGEEESIAHERSASQERLVQCDPVHHPFHEIRSHFCSFSRCSKKFIEVHGSSVSKEG